MNYKVINLINKMVKGIKDMFGLISFLSLIFNNIAIKLGVISSIIVFTLIIKIILTPIYIIRRRNIYLKNNINNQLIGLNKKIRKSKLKAEKNEYKREKRMLLESNNIKYGKFMFYLFIIEMSLIIILTKVFNNYNTNELVLWFNIQTKDTTYLLSIIYALILFLDFYTLEEGKKLDLPKIIIFLIINFLIFKLSISTKSIIIIYWIFSAMFTTTINRIFSMKYFQRKET
ncbi:YidC/Oxa1 family membrane protein insertase [Clostridium frigidicarnis]|uniref:60Kd inner membrane protein n=1 Tax=Clostridium frigidicarnis TaxID=84698 RepID=A0A1I1AHD6_9CLOT|nr:YidC/Oxa1 family membrane protein insertase [Clostridium frigidicarnis]SFB37431.1 60Kd inner membrane protein [Clostridium frigidicarnis]